MGIKHPLHRKKLVLAIKSINAKQDEKSAQLDHIWVTRKCLNYHELFGKEFPPPLWMDCLINVCLSSYQTKIFHRVRIFVLFSTSRYTALQYDLPRGTLLFRLQGSKWGGAQSSRSYIMPQKVHALLRTVCKISQGYCGQSCLVGIAFRLLGRGWPFER